MYHHDHSAQRGERSMIWISKQTETAINSLEEYKESCTKAIKPVSNMSCLPKHAIPLTGLCHFQCQKQYSDKALNFHM